MNVTKITLFIIAFFTPILYQRGNFFLREHSFYSTPLRTRTKLQIHHGHWGLGWILLYTLLREAGFDSLFLSTMLGFGMGLLCDEIIPSLKMPSNDRTLELRVYRASLIPTLIFCLIIAMIFAFGIWFGSMR